MEQNMNMDENQNQNENFDEIKKQRTIGRQIMLVKIVQQQMRMASNIGMATIPKETLAEWAEMTPEELDTFVDFCINLDAENMARDAAYALLDKDHILTGENHWLFAVRIYREYGQFFRNVTEYSGFRALSETACELGYESYMKVNKDIYPVDEAVTEPKRFEAMMFSYLKYYVSSVNKAIEQGYDWDVIKEMMNLKDYPRERIAGIEELIRKHE